MFVQLDDLFIEGLVHITGLPRDYYNFEAAHHRLVGERTGRVFRLGDRLKVIVTRVDVDERKIDFDLIDGSHDGGSVKKRRGKSPRSLSQSTGKAMGDASDKVAKQASRENKGDKKPAAKRAKKPRKRASPSASNTDQQLETGVSSGTKPKKKPKNRSKKATAKTAVKAVSYTHLTLPTICSV